MSNFRAAEQNILMYLGDDRAGRLGPRSLQKEGNR